MNRKHFLKSILGTSALMAMPTQAFGSPNEALASLVEARSGESSGSMVNFSVAPIKTVRVGIIGLGNRGKTLLDMLQLLVTQKKAEIVALSDLDEKNIRHAEKKLSAWQKGKARSYYKNKDDWKNLAKQDNIDLLLIATPWEWHTPMCLFGMRKGKHVACEVPIAYTMNDCWDLVRTAEETKRHCIMIENCCYNEEELFVLNMIERGAFGDLTHTEGAYLHDLRAHILSDTYYKDQWRLKHHVDRDGNFYTTHGLGPIAQYLRIGRGDTFAHLTSMSSRELNLSEAAKREKSPYTTFKCGDMNTTLIKTENGKSIMLQFDVHTGRPYSRINKVVGTKAVHDGYPSRLYIDNGKLEYWGHKWLPQEEYNAHRQKFMHPMIKKLKKVSQDFKHGHGGMDFVMIYRLISCLNLGAPLDHNVYDGVMWSAVTPLSELSVASNSLSLPFPDFTGGTWSGKHELGVMREL